MYQTLVPCPSCTRHVRASEPACPFCAAALPQGLASSAVPSAQRRMTRAAAFVFGASLAVTGCGSDITGNSGGAGGGGGAGGAGGNVSTGPDDDGGAVALYGDPSFDGGTEEDASPPDDDGGAMALYGDPTPIQDGGKDSDDGGNQPIYGSPPPPPKGT